MAQKFTYIEPKSYFNSAMRKAEKEWDQKEAQKKVGEKKTDKRGRYDMADAFLFLSIFFILLAIVKSGIVRYMAWREKHE